MEMNDKTIYKAPGVKSVEIRTQSIICISGGTEQYTVSDNIYDDSDWE